MALVKYGGGVVQMSGSIAGTTFARNSSGNYARARTKPVNPSSSLQVKRRTVMAYLSEYWHEVLTSTQRTAWATYANAVTMNNRLGESIKLSGFNHFIRTNAIQLEASSPIYPNGPTVLSLPSKDPTFAITASVATQKLTLTLDTGLWWWNHAGGNVVVNMGRPQIVTRNFFRGPWQYAGLIVAGHAPPQEMTAPMTLILGQKIWCFAHIYNGDGTTSQPMRASATVAA
jgi:hypothetical protein